SLTLTLNNGFFLLNYCKNNKFLKCPDDKNSPYRKNVFKLYKFSTFSAINSRRDYTKEKNENYVSLQSRCFSEEKLQSSMSQLGTFPSNDFIIKPYLDREFRLQDFVSWFKESCRGKLKTIQKIKTVYQPICSIAYCTFACYFII
ncbi:hypothetical protein NQ317_008447, partial [Molorchus minor]